MRQLTGRKRDTIYTPTVLMLVIIVGISFLGLGLVMPLRALYGRQIGASSTEIGLMTVSYLLAGLLYGFTPGLPFFLAGLVCLCACLVLFMPGLAQQFHAARRNVSRESVEG